MIGDIVSAEYQTDIPDVPSVFFREVKFPSERNITTFDYQILGIFNAGLYNFADNSHRYAVSSSSALSAESLH